VGAAVLGKRGHFDQRLDQLPALGRSFGCADPNRHIRELDEIAVVELAPAAALGLAVDMDDSGCEQRFGIGTGVCETGELEELAEPDGRSTNRFLPHL
jgi:hypothetical protein